MKMIKDLYDKCWDLYGKYKEIVNYLIFGGFTVLVNFVTYFVFARLLGVDEVISNIVSWFVAVLFAYVTNKIFVFESKTETKTETLKEMASFFVCRFASGVIDVRFVCFYGGKVND